MLMRFHQETRDLLEFGGEDLAEEIFKYEMDNHEYSINMQGDDDVLDSLDMTYDDLKK